MDMNILKSVRDGKYVAEFNGMYFREETRMGAISKLLEWMFGMVS